MKRLLVVTLGLLGAIGATQAKVPVTRVATTHPAETAVATAGTSGVLYAQIGTPVTNCIIPTFPQCSVNSQAYETALDQYDDQAADDFVVPSGQIWSITGVDVVGDYVDGRPAYFNVYFYLDAGGLPGTLAGSRLAQSYTGGAQSGTLHSITLTAPANLAAGTYWLSVQARHDGGSAAIWGQTPYPWSWENASSGINGLAVWRNQGGGVYYNPDSQWVDAGNVSGASEDLRFRLNGTAVSGTAPGLAQAFAPASVAINTPSTLTITLTNGNTTAATLTADMVETLAAGLSIAAVPNAATTCGGGAGVGAARNSVTLGSGAVIPASASCTVRVDVSSPAAVVFANSIPIGALKTDAGVNAASADATLTVTGGGGGAAPTIGLAFATTTVTAPYAPSRMTITLSNSNATENALTADMVNAFPPNPVANLIVAAQPNAATTCAGGDGVATAISSVTLGIGAVIPAAGSCTVSVDVTSAQTGINPNTIPAGTLQTNTGSNAASADAMLIVTNSGGGGSFPQDENFDAVTVPALPAGWLTTATGAGLPWVTRADSFGFSAFDTAPNSAYLPDINGAGERILTMPSFTPPGPVTLSFRNQFYLADGDDGGVLEISINGSAFQDVIAAGGSFVSGGYNRLMAAGPIGGRRAWTGISIVQPLPIVGGADTFLATVVNLPRAVIGQPIVLRFRASADSNAYIGPCPAEIADCGGWWIDTLHMFFDTLPGVGERFSPASVAASTDSTITITLSNPMNVDATLTANFIDSLPTGLAATAAATTCIGGAGASTNGATLTLATGAVIPAFGACRLTATVHSSSVGSYANTIGVGAIQASIGSNNTTASATLTVTAASVAVVTPATLALTVQAGTTGSAPLHIANTGAGTLDYVIGEGTSAPTQTATSYKTARSSPEVLGQLVQYGPGVLMQSPHAGNPAMGSNVALRFGDVSQMADNSPGDTGLACGRLNQAGPPNATGDNSWWRRFYFNEHPEVGASARVGSVTVSSGSFSSGSPNGTGTANLPITINLYTIPHGTPVDTIPTAALTPIGSGTGTISSGLLSVTIPVTGIVADTLGTDLVIEYHTDGNAYGNGLFIPGANANPETHPTFLSSTTCGIAEPKRVVNFAGGANFHLTMIVGLNDGTAPSTCTNPADISWLSETPNRGAVTAGAQTDITINANTNALTAGVYMANVCIGTDDPAHPLFAVPVSLTVTEARTCHTTDALFCDGFDGLTSGVRIFTDRSTFLAALAPGWYENPFDDVVAGILPWLGYAQAPWAYTILPTGPGHSSGGTVTPPTLYNLSGVVGVDPSDAIFVISTGNQATAIGGNFYSGQPVGSPVVLTLNDGTVLTFVSQGPGDFRGVISSTPITTLSVSVINNALYESPHMDNLIIGTGQ